MTAADKLEFTIGDIVNQDDVDTIVNAANAELGPGGGVAGAIHRGAGPELEQETARLAPLQPGECTLTKGYQLPNPYVIHCLGPRYGIDEPADKLLAQCYESALDLAEQHRIATIAFPAISTGAFGYPLEEAAAVAVRTVRDRLPTASGIELVRFVLFNQRALEAFRAADKPAEEA